MLVTQHHRSVVMQSAAAATGEGTSLPLADDDGAYEMVAIQLSGTFTATITFQATVDGTNWDSVRMTPLATGTAATTATAAGIYQANLKGCRAVRANITAYTSGSITAVGRAA